MPMQVTNVSETTQVISQHETKAFQIDASPLLFQTLSKNLYSNPKKAVIRETLCNAWDAHKAVGKDDVPVKVTINEKCLVIEDFGPGIPDDMMQDVYCTYSRSTKEGQDNQTGGFGLGCKSPFAITDTFTVISTVNHESTEYLLSMSNAEFDGLPGITAIRKFHDPDKESGLLVKIVKEWNYLPTDLSHFTCMSTVPTEVNGKILEKFSTLPGIPFVMGRYSEGIKYGDMLYPFPKEIRPPLIGMILLAPPNSLTLSPSRESLVEDEKTLRQVQKLVNQATHWLNQESHKPFKEFFVPGFFEDSTNFNQTDFTQLQSLKKVMAHFFNNRDTALAFHRELKRRFPERVTESWKIFRKYPELACYPTRLFKKGYPYTRIIVSNTFNIPHKLLDTPLTTMVVKKPKKEAEKWQGLKYIKECRRLPPRKWWEDFKKEDGTPFESLDELSKVDIVVMDDTTTDKNFWGKSPIIAYTTSYSAWQSASKKFPDKTFHTFSSRSYTEYLKNFPEYFEELNEDTLKYLYLCQERFPKDVLDTLVLFKGAIKKRRIPIFLEDLKEIVENFLNLMRYLPIEKISELLSWLFTQSLQRNALCKFLDIPSQKIQ